MELEYWYDDHTILVGSVALLPDSALEYEWFAVIVYIGGIDHDVTAAMSDARITAFKESFKLGIVDKHWEDLKRAHLDDKLEYAI